MSKIISGKNLHGGIVCRRCVAWLEYKSSKRKTMNKLELEGGVRFALSEMRRWVKRDDKDVKKVTFINAVK